MSASHLASACSDPCLASKPVPGRPKDMGKRSAILEAAKTLFTELGYDGASMDAIAARAGVSKLTVYSHFGDKQNLFIRSVEALCVKWLPDELFTTDQGADLREKLIGIARLFLTLTSTPATIATQRTLIAPRTDERLRCMFWQAGPCKTEKALANFLALRSARGELSIDDPKQAARQFFSLLRDQVFVHLLGGEAAALQCADAFEQHVSASVDFFLRACSLRVGA